MCKKIMLIVLACVWNVGALQSQEARFIQLSGTVEVKASGAPWQTASVGTVIGRNTIVSTGIRSTAVLSLGANTLTVSPLTMLTLEELIQRDGVEETTLFLRTGRIKADVTAPTGVQSEFTVRSPVTTASVRGTSFTFDGRRISVHSGIVSLSGSSSGQRVYVGNNQHSYADFSRHGRITPPFEADVATFRPLLPELAETGSSGGDEPVSAALETVDTPPATILIPGW